MTNNENPQNQTSNPIIDSVLNVNPKQIKSDILMFKNEILKDIKSLSRNLTDKYEATNDIVTQKLESYELKLNSYNQKIIQLSNEIVTDKALKEKINKLIEEKETIKNNICSNDICIKNLEKNFYKDVTNIHNILNETVIYPNVVGPMGKFKSYHSFIDYIIQQLAITSKYRDKNTLDLTQYKNKLETLIQSFKIQLENLLTNANQFTTKSVNECEERMKKLMLIYDDRLTDTRVENANYAVGLEKNCEDLKKELKIIENLKEDIYTKIENEFNLIKSDNEKVYEKFVGYKKEFQFFKDKLSQMSEWIKDVRFRANVGQEIKRKEFFNMANQIDFSKRYGKFKNEGGLQYDKVVKKQDDNTKLEEIDLIKRQLGVGQYNIMDSIDSELKNNSNKRKSMNSLIFCAAELKKLQNKVNDKNNINNENEKDKNCDNNFFKVNMESNSVGKNMRKSSEDIFNNFDSHNSNKNDLVKSNSMYLEDDVKVSRNVIQEEEENYSKGSDDFNQNNENKNKLNINYQSKRNSRNENILLKLTENQKDEKKELNKDIINNITDNNKNLSNSIKEENNSKEIIQTKIDLKTNKNRAKSSNITSNNTTNKDNNVQLGSLNNLKPNYNSIENSDKNKSKTISNTKQSGKYSVKTAIMSKNKENNEVKNNINNNNITVKANLNKNFNSKSSNDIKTKQVINQNNKNNNIVYFDNNPLKPKKISSPSNSKINKLKENFFPRSEHNQKFNSTNLQFGNNINNRPQFLLYSPEEEIVPKFKYINNDFKVNEAKNIQKMVNNLQIYLPYYQQNFIMSDQRNLYNRQGLYSAKHKDPFSPKRNTKRKDNIIQIQIK